jgi:hypothetical protein
MLAQALVQVLALMLMLALVLLAPFRLQKLEQNHFTPATSNV